MFLLEHNDHIFSYLHWSKRLEVLSKVLTLNVSLATFYNFLVH